MKFSSEEETFNWAVQFGRSLKPGDKVLLDPPLSKGGKNEKGAAENSGKGHKGRKQ